MHVAFASFEEWNPDPEIAVRIAALLWTNTLTHPAQGTARRLYSHIDNLELYVSSVLLLNREHVD